MPTAETWREAAIDAWYDAQDHVGQADTDPEPYLRAAADSAVRVVLEGLDAMLDGGNLDDDIWHRRFAELLCAS